MKPYVFIIAVVIAFAGGWAGSSFVASKSIKTPTPQAKSQAQSAATSITDTTTEPIDIYSGNGMSPAALYNGLDNLSGIDFDKRYINYVILMQADLTGMNRLAKEKSVAPALKERATQLWELDSQQLTDLYALQKVLGYSHH